MISLPFICTWNGLTLADSAAGWTLDGPLMIREESAVEVARYPLAANAAAFDRGGRILTFSWKATVEYATYAEASAAQKTMLLAFHGRAAGTASASLNYLGQAMTLAGAALQSFSVTLSPVRANWLDVQVTLTGGHLS